MWLGIVIYRENEVQISNKWLTALNWHNNVVTRSGIWTPFAEHYLFRLSFLAKKYTSMQREFNRFNLFYWYLRLSWLNGFHFIFDNRHIPISSTRAFQQGRLPLECPNSPPVEPPPLLLGCCSPGCRRSSPRKSDSRSPPPNLKLRYGIDNGLSCTIYCNAKNWYTEMWKKVGKSC